MRWLHEMLFPVAVVVMFVTFWVAADTRALERRATLGMPALDPALARHVLDTYGNPDWRRADLAAERGDQVSQVR